MIGFCGAMDFEQRAASFCEVKRMCGMHSGGCAYVNAELALLCDNPLWADDKTIHTCDYGDSYCACAISAEDIPLGEHISGERLAQGYIEEGAAFFGRLSFPYSAAIYDAHHGELVLARGMSDKKQLFYSEKNGVLYFSSALRPLIRLWGGCVNVCYDALVDTILSTASEYPERLFCDIFALKSCEMLIKSCFDKSILQYTADASSTAYGKISELANIKNMRHSLCELLFARDYPNFDIAILNHLKKVNLHQIERQLDKILIEYEDRKLHTDVMPRLEKKSIPLRIKQKGMLVETMMWLDTFNIVLK